MVPNRATYHISVITKSCVKDLLDIYLLPLEILSEIMEWASYDPILKNKFFLTGIHSIQGWSRYRIHEKENKGETYIGKLTRKSQEMSGAY